MSRSDLMAEQNYIDIEKIMEKASAIVRNYQPEKIILFGSYSTGTQTPDSDVDLLVILETEQSIWDVSVEISLMLKHTFPMDIIVKTPKEVAKRLNYGDFFIKDILENGKVLYERTGKRVDSQNRR